MESHHKAALVAAAFGGVGSFIVWILLEDSLPVALLYALIVALSAGAVTWFQQRPRG